MNKFAKGLVIVMLFHLAYFSAELLYDRICCPKTFYGIFKSLFISRSAFCTALRGISQKSQDNVANFFLAANVL